MRVVDRPAKTSLRAKLHQAVNAAAMGPPSLKPQSALLFLIPFALATGVIPQGFCAESCQNCLRSVRFNDSDPTASDLVHSCRSRLALSSTYLCLDLNCGAQSGHQALREHNATCQRTLGVSIPPLSIIANFTSDDISRIRRISKNDSFGPEQPLCEAVVPSSEFFIAWVETLDAWSLATAVFWIFVVTIGVINRTYLALYHSRGLRHSLCSTRIPKGSRAWLKRNLILPATFGYRCAQSVWWCTVPPRIQSLTILVFLIMNVAFTVRGYRVTSGNFYFHDVIDQLLRYVSDRAGIISFVNFPVIWLFGVRNNVALWLTGWDFGTFNNFHRWCARIATIEAVIHSIGYICLAIRYGGRDYLFLQVFKWYWNAGLMAMTFMCLLLPCSVYWMRSQHYEAFLIVHIVLSVLLLLTMLGHVSIFKGQFNSLFWIPAFIWLSDRLMRLFRIFDFNPQPWCTNALAVNDASANIVQLSIPISNRAACKPQPGRFYYLMVLDDTRCWESHPFTVASASARPPLNPEDSDEQTSLLFAAANSAGSGNYGAKHSSTDHMTFLIRPYNSFTSRLRDLAVNARYLKVLVEGPYGNTHPLHMYSHVVFIVGGTGVITPLSYLSLLRGERRTPTELHWAVRESALVQIVTERYLDTALGSSGFSLELYMSSRSGDCPIRQLPSQVRQQPRRPHIPEIIASAVVKVCQGSLAVVACGPEGMVDDTRLAVVDALKSAKCQIDYFQESFHW
ncbi:Ferric reductase transmembrane component 5 [Tolypocladium ophioglossoides CBS 100239]|uniref:Ferric reductase transmembrane component 5 n=1 Tax=Tolypocladium ophioglossoides (strain CBS 100239) TaxID=1163406 RepID=A0A0L0MZ95_TOLOC|nr:Ferric reductase transmembrane component 5 [Tolypocladium ophioglossoides CBS 100239]